MWLSSGIYSFQDIKKKIHNQSSKGKASFKRKGTKGTHCLILKCKSKPQWDRCYFTSTGTGVIKKTDNKCWQGRRKIGTLLHYWWSLNGAAALENTLPVPQKVKYRITTWPLWLLGMYPGETKHMFTQKIMYGYS